MATMYPGELGPTSAGADGTQGPAPGERALFQFFKSAAKPDSAWVVWFEPLIGTNRLEPDFLLFHKDVGFVIVEVKDWSIDRIEMANSDHFVLRGQGKRQNPEKQIRSHLYALQGQLKDLGFTVKGGVKRAGLLFPSRV